MVDFSAEPATRAAPMSGASSAPSDRAAVFPLSIGLLALGAIFTFLSVGIINYWIYNALRVFAANNPERMSEGPVTVSRAITDPAISDLFAFWISIAAITVPMAIAVAMMVVWQQASPIVRRPRRLAFLMTLLILLQFGGSTGMVTLSHFRFPDHDELHMLGSYIMFFSYPLVIITMMVIAATVLRDGAGRLPPGLLRAYRLRMWIGWIIVFMSISYLVLFIIKDWDLGALDPIIYLTYTRTEPAKLTMILFFLMTYLIDSAYALRGR